MEQHTIADESYYITVSTVLDLARRALKIFQNSEIDEKRQLLNFLLQNCLLKEKTLMFEMKTPYNALASYGSHNKWLDTVSVIRTYFIEEYSALSFSF